MYNNKLAVNGISDYTEGSDVHALYLTSKLSYTTDIINVIEGQEKTEKISQLQQVCCKNKRRTFR